MTNTKICNICKGRERYRCKYQFLPIPSNKIKEFRKLCDKVFLGEELECNEAFKFGIL